MPHAVHGDGADTELGVVIDEADGLDEAIRGAVAAGGDFNCGTAVGTTAGAGTIEVLLNGNPFLGRSSERVFPRTSSIVMK